MTPQNETFFEIKILIPRLRPNFPEIKMSILLRGTYVQKKVEVSWRYKKKKKKKKSRGPNYPV
jgi:hypothetical protein